MKRWLRHPLTGPVVATIVVALLVLATTDRFLAVGNLNNLALQVSIVALVAIGSTVVIIVGGIDLSPGSMIALLTMLLASMLKFWGVAFWPAIVLTLVAGAVLGMCERFRDRLPAHSVFHSHSRGAERLSRHCFHVQQRIACVRRFGQAGAAVLRAPIRHPAAILLHHRVFRRGALADAAYEAGPLHLCGRWQRQCGAPFRHQRAPHAIPALSP